MSFFIQWERTYSAGGFIEQGIEQAARGVLERNSRRHGVFCRSLLATGNIPGEVGERRAASAHRRQAGLPAGRIEELCRDDRDASFNTRYGTRGERKMSKVRIINGMLELTGGKSC